MTTDDKIMPMSIRASFTGPRRHLDFVLPGFLRGTIGLLVGAGGSGKSFIALQSAISRAVGEDVFGIWRQPIAQGRTLILSVEDCEEILHNRLHEIGTHLSSDQWDLVDANLEVMPIFGRAFRIAERNGNRVQISWLMNELCNYVREHRFSLLIIDTLNRSLGGLDENSNADMGEMLAVLEWVCREANTAILLQHHANKGSVRDGSTDQAAARGASALVDNARWAGVMAGMSDSELKGFDIAANDRRSWVKLDLPKLNYSASEQIKWLRRVEGGVLVGDEPQTMDKKVINGSHGRF